MKKSCIVLAFAGLATLASAQEFSLSFGGATGSGITDFSTFTIDIFGDASVGTHMLGGSFAIQATLTEFEVLNMTWLPASWSQFNTDGGYAGDGNYNQVIFGQLVIPGVPGFDTPAAGSELGGLIGSLQIDIGQLGFWGIELQLIAQDPFSLQTIDINTGETFQSSNGNLSLGGFSAYFIPAPSSLALIGLGGLACTRRRR